MYDNDGGGTWVAILGFITGVIVTEIILKWLTGSALLIDLLLLSQRLR